MASKPTDPYAPKPPPKKKEGETGFNQILPDDPSHQYGSIALSQHQPQAYTADAANFFGNLRQQLGSAGDFNEIRRGGQQQVMDKAGAMARQLQTGASRGGVAGRGAGTGALRAPAQQSLVQGMRGVERDVEAMKGQRLQQIASATQAATTAQLSMMGYDANSINQALSMKEKALAQVSHKLGDPSFANTLLFAEDQYQRDIAAGMTPSQAGARYYTAVTMGSGQMATQQSPAATPAGGQPLL